SGRVRQIMAPFSMASLTRPNTGTRNPFEMKFIRLALSAAALAAAAGMYPAAAEENPVRQFLNEEFNAASARAEEGNVPATQTANLGESRQQPDESKKNENKKDQNPWAGLSPSPSSVPAKSK